MRLNFAGDWSRTASPRYPPRLFRLTENCAECEWCALFKPWERSFEISPLKRFDWWIAKRASFRFDPSFYNFSSSSPSFFPPRARLNSKLRDISELVVSKYTSIDIIEILTNTILFFHQWSEQQQDQESCGWRLLRAQVPRVPVSI